MFEQAAIPVQDEKGYAKLHSLFDAAFDVRDVEVLLNRVKKRWAAGPRLRDDSEARISGQGCSGVVCGIAGFGSGVDARAVSTAGGESAGGAAAEVFEGLRVLLRE